MAAFQFSNRLLSGFLFFAGIGLLTGLYAGLARLGLLPEMYLSDTGMLHGPLMVNAFLGTLISLERAAALEKKMDPLWTIFDGGIRHLYAFCGPAIWRLAIHRR